MINKCNKEIFQIVNFSERIISNPKDFDLDQVSDTIKKAVEDKGKSQAAVARKLQISSQLLGQYISGKHKPKSDFYLKWKEVFKEDLLNKVERNVSEVQEPLPIYNQPMNTINSLAESNKILAETNRTLAEAIVNERKETPVVGPATFSELLAIVAEIGTKGGKWKSIHEANAELSKLIPGMIGDVVKDGIQTD